MAATGNGRTRAIQFAAAIIGTVIVSIVGAFFAFGATQSDSIARLEASEAEDARQRQIDQATVAALSELLRVSANRIGELETRIAVLESRLEQLSDTQQVP